ncbi:threonine ammonia-lyase [Shewanella electrodiphila]|uniref:threonine ammonia-lyase n=1 Tax=Shewanella electrodiphila TaxID=934143 RepID=UPI0031FE53AC
MNGVVTFSTGNHGLSVATSAKMFGIPAIVVVPVGSNPVKIKLIKNAGADVIESGENFDEAAKVVTEINQTRGYYYVHPANEPLVVNGVGTEFLEIIEDIPDIDAVILPLGGGSEVASAVTVLKSISPRISIYAVQAELSSAAYQSWSSKEIVASSNQTFAGGFATGTAYETTFNIYRDKLDDFVLLSEQEILQGIALAAHHTKNLVEGAGSSTIMAAWKLRKQLAGKKIVLQFSGSNASPDELEKACELSGFRDGKVT